jgi:hypothetical protein
MRKPRPLACPLLLVLVALGAAAYGDPPAAGPAVPAPADPATSTTVEVRGLTVNGPELKLGDHTIPPVNGLSNTCVSLLVVHSAGGLISLDTKATRFTKLADDKGTDLLKETDTRRHFFTGIQTPQFAEDGTAAMVALNAPGLPAAGAKELTIQGVLVFQTATQKKTVEQAAVPLKIGSTITAGPFALEITELAKPSPWMTARPGPGGGDPKKMKLAITLRAKQDMSDICTIAFFDDAGHQIDSSDGMTIVESATGGGSTSSGYTGSRRGMTAADQIVRGKVIILAQAPDAVTVKITYWADKHELKVPVDLKAGLGL